MDENHRMPQPLSFDWNAITFCIFDVDGTLYDQKRMRMLMMRDLVLHMLLKRNIRVPRILKAYRRIREAVGDEELEAFEPELIARTARETSCSPELITAVVEEWIEQRPLRYMLACRYNGLTELFTALKRKGKIIGILSDYPAKAKLAALGLAADFIVTANDSEVERLKPHPKGLQVILKQAGIAPQAAVLIGDRGERDGESARRAAVRPLIRSSKPVDNWETFPHFTASIFAPLFL